MEKPITKTPLIEETIKTAKGLENNFNEEKLNCYKNSEGHFDSKECNRDVDIILKVVKHASEHGWKDMRQWLEEQNKHSRQENGDKEHRNPFKVWNPVMEQGSDFVRINPEIYLGQQENGRFIVRSSHGIATSEDIKALEAISKGNLGTVDQSLLENIDFDSKNIPILVPTDHYPIHTEKKESKGTKSEIIDLIKTKNAFNILKALCIIDENIFEKDDPETGRWGHFYGNPRLDKLIKEFLKDMDGVNKYAHLEYGLRDHSSTVHITYHGNTGKDEIEIRVIGCDGLRTNAVVNWAKLK